MPSRITCYLRRERRKWAFTQQELAFLFGRTSAAHISRLEQCVRVPSARVLIAARVLFGMPVEKMFPTLYTEIEESVLARASELLDRLENDLSLDALRKKEILAALLANALMSQSNDAEP